MARRKSKECSSQNKHVELASPSKTSLEKGAEKGSILNRPREEKDMWGEDRKNKKQAVKNSRKGGGKIRGQQTRQTQETALERTERSSTLEGRNAGKK